MPRRTARGERTATLAPIIAIVATPVAVLGVEACSASHDAEDAPPLSPADASSADAHAATPDVTAPRGRDRLSQTGLYAAIATKTLSSDAWEFEPTYALWSDGAVKKRWIRLPPGATIDASDSDHWRLPVGTQFFKEFSVAGKRVETRLIERVGATGKDEDDYWFGAFVWRDDESDADFARDGAPNARGTSHDVPSVQACWACHVGEPGHALGFSALQLSHSASGLTLDDLRRRGLVPSTLADAPRFADPIAREALGYLHANCGHCHNENGASWPDTNMTLRLSYGESNVTTTKLWTSTVRVDVQSYAGKGFTYRIAPGAPDESAVARRMEARGDGGVAMPPLATEAIDPAGSASVRRWIASLPRDAGAD